MISKNKVFIVSLLVTALFIVWLNSDFALSKNSAILNSGAAKAVSLTAKEKEIQFEQWSKNVKKFQSVEAASSETVFKIKEPAIKPKNAQIIGVFVDNDENKEERIAFLLYGTPGNPISIQQHRQVKPEYQKWVQEMDADKKAGFLKSDTVPQLLEINGYQGYGIEPGFNIIGNAKVPRPGFVDWTMGNVQYTITGTSGDKAASLRELIEIAESIK